MSIKRPTLIFLLVLLYVGVLPLAYALRYPSIAPAYFFAGDAFYYLDITRHSLGMHGFSFDGEFITNGFHPLWEFLLLALGKVGLINFRFGGNAPIRVFSLDLVLLSLGAACFCATMARYLQRQTLALLIVAPGLLWACTGLMSQDFLATWTYVNGMESALALLCFAVALSLLHEPPISSPRIIVGATFLGLAILARLDDVFISGAVAAFLLWRTPAGRRLQMTLNLSPIAVLLLAYLAYNLHTVGVVLPISGATKAGFALWLNLKWVIGLFLPIVTGDGPAALLPPGYFFGYTERSARLTEMVLPALLCAAEILWVARRKLPARNFTLVHAMAAGVIAKAAYNLLFVQAWNQGQWYYIVSVFIANFLLVLWIDRLLERLRLAPVESPRRLRIFLALHALGVLLAFNLFITRRNAVGGIASVRLLEDNAPIRGKLRSMGASRFLEFDDGFTSFVADVPSAAGLGLALDREAAQAAREGHFLDLIYHRGYRAVVAHGLYAGLVDRASEGSEAGKPIPLAEIHPSELLQYQFVPVGGDGSADEISYYLLAPRPTHKP